MFDSLFHHFNTILQIFMLDLALSGDNAIVVALACRNLPRPQMKRAIIIGTGAAIGLRVLLATLIGFLLQVPSIRLIGALLLVVIAIRLLIEEEGDERAASDDQPDNVAGAVMTILVADLVMSLDNVVALAAVSAGSVVYLVFGLLLSVPLLMYGSRFVTNLFHRLPSLISIGGALLGYIAGGLAVSDPMVIDAINVQSPALAYVVPFATAVFVLFQSRIVRHRRAQFAFPSKVSVPPDRRYRESPVPISPTNTVLIPQAARFSMGKPVLITVALAGGLLIMSTQTGFWTGNHGNAAAETNANKATASREIAYLCQDGSKVFYRHGNSTINMITGDVKIGGFVDATNKIAWDIPKSALSEIHSELPRRIEDNARSITIFGDGGLKLRCPRYE